MIRLAMTNFWSRPWWARFYILAGIAFLVAWLLPGGWSAVAFSATCVMLAAGFCHRFGPRAAAVWAHPLGKVVLTVTQIVIGVFSHAMASLAVNSALGLPPEHFPNTTNIVALALFIPICAVVTTTVLSMLMMLMMLSAITVQGLINRPDKVGVTLLHTIGGFGLIWVLSELVILPNGLVERPPGWVRGASYAFDFHALPLIPGIGPSERAVILDNGWTAIATVSAGDVRIELRPAVEANR